MQCEHCLKDLPKEARFCLECGMPVNGGTIMMTVEKGEDPFEKTNRIKVVCPQCEEIIPPRSFYCPNCKLPIEDVDSLNKNNPVKFPSKVIYIKELLKTLFIFLIAPTVTAPYLLRFKYEFIIFILLPLSFVTSLFVNNMYVASGLEFINPDSEFMQGFVSGLNSYKPCLSECLLIVFLFVCVFFVARYGVKKIEAFKNLFILLFAPSFVNIFYLPVAFLFWITQVPVTSLIVFGLLFNIWSFIVSLYAISSIYSITKWRIFLSMVIPMFIIGFIVHLLLKVFAFI